jgi:diguanylate cyclase (GGDEF)-like protein
MPTGLSLAILLFTSLAMAAAMAIAWHQLGRERHICAFVIAYLSTSAQWVLNWAGLAFESAMLMYFSGIAMIAGIMFAYLGIQLRHDKASSVSLIGVSTLAVGAAASLVTYLIGHEVALAFLIPGFAALTMMLSATKMVPLARKPRAAERFCSAAFVLFSVFELGIMFLGYRAITDGQEGWRESYRNALTIGLPTLFIVSGIATIMVIIGDVPERPVSQALQDQLTGLLNRRGLTILGRRAVASSRRSGRPLTAIAIDLDDFKTLNDRFGHAVGDRALRRVASALQHTRRREDIVCCYGGGEFILLLPNSKNHDARQTAKQLSDAIQSLCAADPIERAVDFSFGIAELVPVESLEQLIERADLQLYAAKCAKRSTKGVGPFQQHA